MPGWTSPFDSIRGSTSLLYSFTAGDVLVTGGHAYCWYVKHKEYAVKRLRSEGFPELGFIFDQPAMETWKLLQQIGVNTFEGYQPKLVPIPRS
jgi:hypothetical protein